MPEQGALLLKALERAKDELYARPDGSSEPSGSRARAVGGEPFDYGWAIEDLQAKAGIE
jgi:hypothetical protein